MCYFYFLFPVFTLIITICITALIDNIFSNKKNFCYLFGVHRKPKNNSCKYSRCGKKIQDIGWDESII